MKTKRLILAFITLLSVVSCKNEEKLEKVEKIEEPKVDNLFNITLNATVLKDDSFQVYYREQGDSTYDEKKSLFVEFKGSKSPQNIIFKLPENVIPEFIRLDFGTNKEQSPIKVNSFKLSYFGKEFSVNGSDFFNYMLVEQATMKLDKATSTVTPILSNGSYDPITSSELALKTEIEKITH